MNISKPDLINNYTKNDKDPLSIKVAKKAYMDEKLTGLTDEEKEEIEKRCKAYLKENPINTKEDLQFYLDYIKSLLKEFGFKGDYESFAKAFANSSEKNDDIDSSFNMDIVHQFNKNNNNNPLKFKLMNYSL